MAYIGNSPSNIQRGRRAVYEFTATAGQTVFTGVDDNGLTLDLLEYNENDVYLNGSRLVLNDDYTVSGDTLTLLSGAALNDILVIVTQDEVANAGSYTKAESDSRYINYDGDIINGDLQVVGNISLTDLTTRHIYLTGGVRNIGGNDLFTYMTGTDSGGNERGIIVGQGTVRPNADGAISLGQSAVRFTDLHLSGSVNLGSDSVASDINAIGDVLNISVDSNGNSGGTPNINFRVGTSTKLRINSSGNVGIGSTNPEALLHVEGASTGQMMFRTSSSSVNKWLIGKNSAADFSIGEDGNEWLYVERDTGRVGIGTQQPYAKLHVYGNTDISIPTTPNGTVINEVGDYSGTFTIGTDGTNLGNGAKIPLVFRVDSDGQSGAHISSAIEAGRESGGWQTYLAFYTNSTTSSAEGVDAIQQKMYIGSEGNIEFKNGTSLTQHISYKDYGYYFDYEPTKQTWVDTTDAATHNFTHALCIRTPVKDSTNVAALVISENGGQASGRNNITFRNEDMDGIGYDKARIYTEVGGSYNSTNFFIDVADSSRNIQNRFRIDQSGTFYGSGSNNISDARLKEDIETIQNPIDIVKQLTGRTFKWNEKSTKQDGQVKYGFIAQEVNEVLPDLVAKDTGLIHFDDNDNVVSEDKATNSSMSVHENGIIPILLEAIKELTARVEELEKK